MPIKNGQYGTYYEWTDNGTVKRVSLQTIPDWTPYKKNFKKSELELTEEDCAKLVAGEKVEIKKSFSEGYKIISCELTSYEDKRDGTPRYSIKATTVQEVFDKNIIQDAIKAGKFQIEGTKLAVIKENLEAQLKELELGNPKWEISYSEQEIAEKEIRVVYLYCSKSPDKTLTYGISNYGSSNISWYLKFDMEYNLIEQITDDEYGDLCLQHRTYAQKLREEQAEKARQEKEQKELEEIKARPWKDITWGELSEKKKEDLADLKERLTGIYQDIDQLVLFREKSYQSYSNSSHRAIESAGWYSVLIKDILDGVLEKDITRYYSGWNEVSITEKHWEGDADVTHCVKVKALPTD